MEKKKNRKETKRKFRLLEAETWIMPRQVDKTGGQVPHEWRMGWGLVIINQEMYFQ